jgi:hypothetical protein
LDKIHKIATKRKTTLKALVDEGLRQVVATSERETTPFKLKDCSFGGQGLTPEFQNASWDEIRDEIYGLPRK